MRWSSFLSFSPTSRMSSRGWSFVFLLRHPSKFPLRPISTRSLSSSSSSSSSLNLGIPPYGALSLISPVPIHLSSIPPAKTMALDRAFLIQSNSNAQETFDVDKEKRQLSLVVTRRSQAEADTAGGEQLTHLQVPINYGKQAVRTTEAAT